MREGKEFVVRLHSYGSDLSLDDPWFRVCASRRMLDIANSYVGLLTKLEYVDVWYSVPQPGTSERVASQKWHRDFNDRKLVKAFLYLVDVDETMGPFEYVPGSAGDGRMQACGPGNRSGRTIHRRMSSPDAFPTHQSGRSLRRAEHSSSATRRDSIEAG